MSEYIDQIAARIEEATEGTWRTDKHAYGVGVSYADKWDEDMQLFVETNGLTYTPNTADAEFIANARTDLPRLLAAVRAVEELAEGWGNIGYPATREQIAALRGAAALIRRALTKALEGER